MHPHSSSASRKLLPLLLAAACALALAAAGPVRSETACIPPSDRETREILDAAIREGRSPALAAVLITPGEVRFLSARSESGPMVGPDSVFEIGSCTKVFTGLLLALTETSGRAGPRTTLRQALPQLQFATKQTGRITLGELTAHDSGLPRMPSNWIPKDQDDPYADYGPDELLEFLAAYQPDPTKTPSYLYSNLGAGLLGFAISETEGRSYSDLIQDRILAPLGMGDSFVAIPEGSGGSIVQGHDASGRPVPAWGFNALAGAEALKSSPRDLAVFLQAQLDPDSTSLEKGIRRSHHELGPGPAKPVAMAYGWHRLALGNQTLFMHDGGTGGHRSFMGFNPATGRGVVLLSAMSRDISDMGLHLLCSAIPVRELPKIVELPPEQLRRYVGDYLLFPDTPDWRTVLRVVRYDEGLSMRAEGDLESVPLVPVDEKMFIFKHRDDGAVRFESDDTGRIVRLKLLTPGEENSAERVSPHPKPSAD